MSVKIIKDIMLTSEKVPTINVMATLKDAMNLMKSSGQKYVVVEKRSDDDAYGILTQKDILRAVIIEKGDVELLNVYDVSTRPALSVSQYLNIKHAGKMILNHSIKQLLVIDNNQLMGVIDIELITQEIFSQLD